MKNEVRTPKEHQVQNDLIRSSEAIMQDQSKQVVKTTYFNLPPKFIQISLKST